MLVPVPTDIVTMSVATFWSLSYIVSSKIKSPFEPASIDDVLQRSDAISRSTSIGLGFKSLPTINYTLRIQQRLDSLIYGTYFGGSQSAEHVDGGTSRFDKNGVIYQFQ